ncbi:GIY-YIG nuclease family protein [Mycoplasmopsis agassizii]|uniref:GIY-YIG nuclease family protein n=1 Tax=Mycoplasmopsis agassizii TaxID=33922 RepID=UPI003528C173
MNLQLEERIKSVTTKPGVYLWKNKYDHVLYVGKAKNLRNRMVQYLKGSINSYKTNALMEKVEDFEVFVVENEKEALLLERNLINQHKPYYNILLIDDKRYPYIKIILKKDKIEVRYERIVSKKSHNSLFYGPFPTGSGANIIKRMIERELFFENGLPIVNTNSEYWKDKFLQVKNLLKLGDKKLLKNIESQMHQAAEIQNFEIAKELRDTLIFLKKLHEKQVVQLENIADIDVISAKEDNGLIYVTFLFYRYGILISKSLEVFEIKTDFENSLVEFVNQFYAKKAIVANIILEPQFKNYEFSFDEKIKLFFPEKGLYRLILNHAIENTNQAIKEKANEFKMRLERNQRNLSALEKLINLDEIKRIILIDNSHISNINPVSAIVSYVNGEKKKDEYRKINLAANDERLADVDYMKQAVTKYFSNLEKRIKMWPDLIIVDGSYPQLHEVKNTLHELEININVIALTKDERHKTKYLIDLNESKIKIEDRNLFNFLSEMQEEVDRFAKESYRKRKGNFSLEGDLKKIPGVGEKRELLLLEHFSNYNNIFNASLEELSKFVPLKIAQEIKNKLGQKELEKLKEESQIDKN